METNIELNAMSLRGYVKRVNDKAMFGKKKAVTGEIQVPLNLESSTQNVDSKISIVFLLFCDLNVPDITLSFDAIKRHVYFQLRSTCYKLHLQYHS